MKKLIKENALYAAFAAALIGTLGSLYFSEIANFPPCVLCWYQRSMMYPLTILLGFAVYTRDRLMVLPALVMAGVGWLIAVYHNLLYYNILPEAAAPCVAGISCTTKHIEWLGFITIPLLSLAGFTFVIVSLIIFWKNNDQRS